MAFPGTTPDYWQDDRRIATAELLIEERNRANGR